MRFHPTQIRRPITSRPSAVCHRIGLLLLSLMLLLSLGPTFVYAQDPQPHLTKEQVGDGEPALPPEVELITLPVSAEEIATSGAHVGAAALTGGIYMREAEPNGIPSTATPLTGVSVKARGNIYPSGDVDLYSFDALAGDRVYAAVQTFFDASASGDSVLDLLGTDGMTVIETDLDDGTFNASSSTIAGAVIPSNGTYFLRLRHNTSTDTIRPYDLYFSLQRGAPAAEGEPNNSDAAATPLPTSGWVGGAISDVSPVESDFFSLSLAAGDSVFLSLDMNPERDAGVWNGRLGFGLFGNPSAKQILIANDANAGSDPADPNSEALFFTVLTAGTYYVYVDSVVAAGLGANATYTLSVAVFNEAPKPGPCTTYTNDTPLEIPTGPGLVSSPLAVPGNPQIADLDVSINLTHTFMADLDVHLVSPAGNDNGLFTDIGVNTVGSPQTLMDLRLDDDAALPPVFPLTAPMVVQPELSYRLGWFNGEDAGGDWTLMIRDDSAGDGGTLNAWSITVCEPAPPSGPAEIALYSFDFEDGEAGFTHSGAQDEWELGLPATAVINTCASGVNCWKTDLDDTYNASSSQELLSPVLNLAGQSGPIRLQWAMRYQMESANFDHFYVEAREVGNPLNAIRVFEWLDATMVNNVGSPTTSIDESAGWGVHSADISALAGLNIELVFHLDSDASIELGGVAVDDVQVLVPGLPDLSLSKSVSPTIAAPGQAITYTLTFSNTGSGVAGSILLTDVLPIDLANLSVSSSTVITDTAASPAFVWQVQDLAPQQSATVTVTGQVDSQISSPGVFTNTATIAAAYEISPADNIASAPVTIIVPDMAVLGNGQVIANGDTTPTTADHTDFGPVTLGQTSTHTFTVGNGGAADLILNSLSLSGTAAIDFSLNGITTPTSIAPAGSATFEIHFSPTAVGPLTATVTIVSNDADSTPYTFDIQGTGTNLAPIADAGSDQSVTVAALVTLDGSGSSDPDGHLPLSYGWVQSGGTAVMVDDADTAQPTFTAPAAPDTLTFTLVVTDSYGAASATDTMTVTVSDSPLADLQATNDGPTNVGAATHFSATLAGGSNAVFSWDFGDGNSGSGATPDHTYSAAGVYTAQVTASNAANTLTATTVVTVVAAAPEPTFDLYYLPWIEQ